MCLLHFHHLVEVLNQSDIQMLYIQMTLQSLKHITNKSGSKNTINQTPLETIQENVKLLVDLVFVYALCDSSVFM